MLSPAHAGLTIFIVIYTQRSAFGYTLGFTLSPSLDG
jgi:hypothetical protein